ncbi:Lrp/AsnC family transcriptional regulator [Kutzneria buriramensis]|uniref:DNA-binding Lrp family transcriptional regulator n=1 Tax=Kutzneria buriramensis TaxID=1045776 RepID=A0A3E0G569_9PSEU|nr:Lrp/AsnC family transcriptional regulator [Kutzneria buriramensis]REH17942.1 DNA-binding Lrp family transcriptional regulator [Kutzneria buriramensis]
MERLDRQIVHCLLRDGRLAFRRIAEVLDVSEQTVARRYRGMHADGAIRVHVAANEQALGLRRWFVRIQCRPDAAWTLAETLAARADVSWVSVTSGGSEVICVSFSDPARVDRSVLHRLPRTSQVLNFTAFTVLHMYVGSATKWLAFDDPLTSEQASLVTTRPAKASRTEIRPDDERLLAELAADGRATVTALSRATGLPQSRVATRVDELLTGGAAHVAVDLAPAKFGFDAIAYLWLTVLPSAIDETGRAVSLMPETTFTATVSGTANLLATVTCRDLEALYTLVTSKIGALPAIRQVEVVPVLHRLKQGGTLVRHDRLVTPLSPAVAHAGSVTSVRRGWW